MSLDIYYILTVPKISIILIIMGGCASSSGKADPFALLESLQRKSDGWAIGKTKFTLFKKSPLEVYAKALVIPLYGGEFDSNILEPKKKDLKAVEDYFKELTSAGNVSEQLKNYEIVITDFLPNGQKTAEDNRIKPLDNPTDLVNPKKLINNIPLISNEDSVAPGLEKIVLVPIPKDPSFVREKLSHILLEVFRICEEEKIDALTFPKMYKTGMLGTTEPEIMNVIAKTLKVKLGRIPAAEEFVFSEVNFATGNEGSHGEIKRCFNENFVSKEEMEEKKENESDPSKSFVDFITLQNVKLPSMPEMKMPEMKMPEMPKFNMPTLGMPNAVSTFFSNDQPSGNNNQQVTQTVTTTTTTNNQQTTNTQQH